MPISTTVFRFTPPILQAATFRSREFESRHLSFARTVSCLRAGTTGRRGVKILLLIFFRPPFLAWLGVARPLALAVGFEDVHPVREPRSRGLNMSGNLPPQRSEVDLERICQAGHQRPGLCLGCTAYRGEILLERGGDESNWY